MRHMRRAIAFVVMAACGDDGTVSLDAMPTGNAMTHVVYLNFEGQAVVAAPSGGTDDATMNQSKVVTTPATLAKWLATDSERVTKIGAIVAEVDQILAPYGVYVKTERPAVGSYEMIVLSDDAATKINRGLMGVFAVTSDGCNTIASQVGPRSLVLKVTDRITRSRG